MLAVDIGIDVTSIHNTLCPAKLLHNALNWCKEYDYLAVVGSAARGMAWYCTNCDAWLQHGRASFRLKMWSFETPITTVTTCSSTWRDHAFRCRQWIIWPTVWALESVTQGTTHDPLAVHMVSACGSSKSSHFVLGPAIKQTMHSVWVDIIRFSAPRIIQSHYGLDLFDLTWHQLMTQSAKATLSARTLHDTQVTPYGLQPIAYWPAHFMHDQICMHLCPSNNLLLFICNSLDCMPNRTYLCCVHAIHLKCNQTCHASCSWVSAGCISAVWAVA